jgi:hypothetical protein
MSPLLTGLFDRLIARRPKDFVPDQALSDEKALADNHRAEERRACVERALLEWIDEEDTRHAEIAWVSNRSKDGLGINSPFRLEPGWAVLATLSEEAPLKAMVRHCEPDQGGFRTGLKIVRRERRRHDRTLVRGHATVVFQHGVQSRRQVRARILDVSEGGIGLSGETAIPEQTPVSIEHDGWQRMGTVTHGRAEGERYVFGVQFVGPPRLISLPDLRD